MTRVYPRNGIVCWADGCTRFGAKIATVKHTDHEASKVRRWPRACPLHLEHVELAFALELVAWRRRHLRSTR